MGTFHHLDPEERQQIIDNIVDRLEKRLVFVVAKMVGQYAATEPQVIERIQKIIEQEADMQIHNRLRFKWLSRLLFK